LRPSLLAAVAALSLVPSLQAQALPGPPRAFGLPVDDPDWMFEVLEQVREKYNLPALSASIVIGDRVVAASAVGRRKVDDPTPVRRTDRFKIGSVSKPVTATLIGALVEAKVMSFEDTMEQMFPELRGSAKTYLSESRSWSRR
jgi:CubicO group peptidase (beta-lactamase class C family)